MDYNLYQEDMLTSHYRIRDYNVFLEHKLSKSGFMAILAPSEIFSYQYRTYSLGKQDRVQGMAKAVWSSFMTVAIEDGKLGLFHCTEKILSPPSGPSSFS